jgi:SAM-dependent methyltransferase
VPDALFSVPRLARIYDGLDADRSDLDAYLAIVEELGARSVLDVGCGTGTLACLLAARGLDEVIGVDPAGASLDVAWAKPGAEQVVWLAGDATGLPALGVDLATMTGNVAQVFVTDESWRATLQGVGRSLRPGGHLVFETRDPAYEGWRSWNRAGTFVRVDLPGAGVVEHWVDLVDVDLTARLVTFRGTYRFERTGDVLTSDSTLRFRRREEVEASLACAGFDLIDLRGAPDRPGKELVFVAAGADRRRPR